MRECCEQSPDFSCWAQRGTHALLYLLKYWTITSICATGFINKNGNFSFGNLVNKESILYSCYSLIHLNKFLNTCQALGSIPRTAKTMKDKVRLSKTNFCIMETRKRQVKYNNGASFIILILWKNNSSNVYSFINFFSYYIVTMVELKE